MTRTALALRYGSMLLIGLLGAGLFQVGSCTYKDLSFLHTARVLTEQQAQRPPQAAPAPTK
jgi:hypothetical protein